MTNPPHKRFIIETVFDGDGDVIASAAPRPRRLVPIEEVEAIRAEAYGLGERSATVMAEQAAAASLAQVSHQVADALSTLAAVAHEHRIAVADLAMAAARKIAGEALDRFPEAPAAAAMHALARELEASPKLTVHVPPDMAERLQAALTQAAMEAGYPGQITVRPNASLPPAAFTFDWGDGRAVFDPEASAARVADALQSALAAEGLHGEPLTPADAQERPTHG